MVQAPEIQGLSSNAGAPASGSSTAGTPSVYLGVQVESIRFDYSGAALDDGQNLRIDQDTDVSLPEYLRLVRTKPATKSPFDSSTTGPAAYVIGLPLKFQAQFRSADLTSAEIRATTKRGGGGASAYGNIGQKTVSFSGGLSPVITFTSDSVQNKISAEDIIIEWKIVSGTTVSGQTITASDLGETHHRIYTLKSQPVAPQTEPWAKTLEISAGMLHALPATPSDAAIIEALAKGLFYSEWRSLTTAGAVRFFEPKAAYVYNPSVCLSLTCHLGLTEFPLKEYFELLISSDLQMQCNDNSNFHSILAAALGISARPTGIVHAGTAPPTYVPIVTGTYVRAGEESGPAPVYPRTCRIDPYNYHVVGSITGSVNLYDVSGRCAKDTLSAACSGLTLGCPAESNFFNVSRSSYLPLAFPAQTILNTVFFQYEVTIETCSL